MPAALRQLHNENQIPLFLSRLHFSSGKHAKDTPTRLHILLWGSQFSPNPAVSCPYSQLHIPHLGKNHFPGAPCCQDIPVVAEDLGLPQTLMLWVSTWPPHLKHCCGSLVSMSGINLSFTLAQVRKKSLGNEARKQQVGGDTQRHHHHLPTSLLT